MYLNETYFRYIYLNPTPDGVAISWELRNGLIPYETIVNLVIEKANNINPEEGSWTRLETLDPSTVYYLDPTPGFYTKRLNVSYRIGILTETEIFYTQTLYPLGLARARYATAYRAISRRLQLSPRHAPSLPGILLKRRHVGISCTVCTDADTKEVIFSDCTSCYGTGIVGGYYIQSAQPVTITSHSPINLSLFHDTQATGTVNPSTIQALIPAYIYVDPYDVWVCTDNNRRFYITESVVAAEIGGCPLLYKAELRLAPPEDIIYTVPLS